MDVGGGEEKIEVRAREGELDGELERDRGFLLLETVQLDRF